MSDRALHITQVSSWLHEGGAERVAVNLHHAFRSAGHDARLVVGGFSGADPDRAIDDPNILRMPNDRARGPWARTWMRARSTFDRDRPIGRACAGAMNVLAEPMRAIDRTRGHEEFRFPGTRRLLELAPATDILHCHNLHGGYFDLRRLAEISRRLPVFITLHDHWLLGGHCSYPFECQRWLSGCGNCPHLNTYPELRRDATRYNWRRKADIYARSRFYVAAPSRWLLDRAQRSMLAPAIIEARVIPYGVDLETFRPGDGAARRQLDLPDDAHVLLYAANRLRVNAFKDFETLRGAVERLSTRIGGSRRLIFIALGDSGAPEQVGNAEVRYVPFQRQPGDVARYYQAADVFVHAARADNFPNTVLEALACGTPVVATAVGGIVEQIDDLDQSAPTGALVPPADAGAMADALARLLADDDLRRRLGENAARRARQRFHPLAQRDAYLEWFAQAKEDVS